MDTKKIVIRYALLYYLSTLLLFALAVYIIYSAWYMMLPIFIAVYIFLKLKSNYLNRKYIYSALIDELDIEKYMEIRSYFKTTSSLVDEMQSAYYKGDYASAINIGQCMLKSKKHEKRRILYIFLLTRSYFEIGDMEKVCEMCELFYTEVKKQKNSEKLIKQYKYMEFARLYSKGDYTACKELYDDIVSKKEEINLKNERLTDIQLDFTYAVSLYKCGDTEQAGKIFEQIAAASSTLNYSKLSRDYLKAMEEGVEYSYCYSEPIVIDESLLPHRKAHKAIRTLTAVCVALMIAGVVFGYAMLFK